MALSSRSSFPNCDSPNGCHSCASRAYSAWNLLSEADLQFLSDHKKTRHYKAGQIIFFQDDPCYGVYCIESGLVALRKTDEQGRSVIVRLVHPGETVGYRTFFSGGNFTSSAESLAKCRVCFIEKSVLEYLLDRNKEVMRDFTRQLANELKRSEEDMLYRSTLPARARLAHLLLNLLAHADIELKRKDLEWELPLSRQDMAAILGIRPETIARTLHSFEEEGVAHFEGRKVKVPQLDLLEAEAEEI